MKCNFWIKKELESQDNVSGTTLKGKPCSRRNYVVGSAPTGKNSDKFVGSSRKPEAYQVTTPASQTRNARLATVYENKCCSGAPGKTVCHEQLCGGSSLTLQSVCDGVTPSLSESISYEDTKNIRRLQYITNKRVKRSRKPNPRKDKSLKVFKEHKSKRNKAYAEQIKALVALPGETGIELAAGFVCQYRRRVPGRPDWFKYLRPDATERGCDFIWFHLEKLISVIQLLRNCNSLMDMVHIMNLYLGIYFDGSVVEGLLDLFRACSQKIMSSQSTGINAFKSLLNNWQALKESEAARQFFHFIATVLATGLCKVNNINLQFKGLEIFKMAAAKKVANLTDLIQVVIETAVFFYERGCTYLSTNNLWDLFYTDQNIVTFEKEFAFVVSNKAYAVSGEWSEMNMSSMDYFNLLEKLTCDIVGMIKLSTGSEKSNLLSKLIMLEKVKVDVKRANVAPTMRMKPFGIVLFGGTGVGKSSVLPYIIHYLNTVNGFESSRDRVVTLNPAEKYQSEYKSNTNVVIIDDIMNQKLEVSEGSPGDLIIRLLNNIPAAALKADVDSKGNIMMAPNFVYGTTNVKTLCAHQLSNEPVSILRRFEYFVTMTVKEDYSRSDSKMLDGSKIPAELVPDAWWFKVEYVVPTDVHDGHPAKPTFHVAMDDGRPMEKVNFQTLLDFLGHRSMKHFIEQKNFVGKSADVFRMQICKKCSQFDVLCKCAINDAQNDGADDEDPDDLPPSLNQVLFGDFSDSDSMNIDYSNLTDEQIDEQNEADLLIAEQLEEFRAYQRRGGMTFQAGFDWFSDAFDPEKIKERKEKRARNLENSLRDIDLATFVEPDSSMRDVQEVNDSDEDEIGRNGLRFSAAVLGRDLPRKTRFEYVRDHTVDRAIKNPFIHAFITGQYNSVLGWSAVCWNFLAMKWKENKLDCMIFMTLLLVNSLVIAVLTVPLAFVTRVGLLSVQKVDTFYSWAADHMVSLVLRNTSLVNLRAKRIYQIRQAMKVSLYGVSLLSVIYVVRRGLKAYKAYTHQGLSEGGSLPVDEQHKVDHWAPVVMTKLTPSLKSSTTSPDALRGLIEKKLGNATLCCTQTGRRCQILMFPMCNNIWLVNSHALTGYPQRVDVTVREPGTIGPNFSDMIGINNTYHIPDNDLALVILTSGGSQYDFTDFFPKVKEQVRYMASIIYKSPDATIKDFRVLVTPKIINYQGPTTPIKVQGYHYATPEPTFEGMCMSPLMTYDSKPQIIGFHCCGKTGTREGGATMLCRDEILLGIDDLKRRVGVMVAHSACPNGLNFEDIGPYKTVSLDEVIHSKSPFRFLEKGSFNLYGQHTGPRQKATTAVTKTLLSDAVAEEFGVPCIWGPPEGITSYVPKRNEVVKMCGVSAMDADRMALAATDFCASIIDQLPASAIRGIQPLSKEITLSGQDGISQLRSVVMSTSCGFPINKPKDMVLSRTGVSTELVTDVIEAPDYVWERVEKCEKLLLDGKRCHFVFKASFKDEPKKIGSGKVRVFAGVSLEGLLIVRKYFLPLGVVIMRNPYLFESAVGINAHGKDWDRFVKHVTQKGSDRMIAGDYASFDSSMSPTASMAAFSCLLHLAKRCGYSDDDLTVMRGIATEICYPTYDFFGEIVVVAGSEPSGHPMTVFVNNIVNSLYIRYAYYSIYSFDRERLFNSVVTQMNYGDDNVMSVSEDRKEFNHTAIQRELGKSGVVYTMADKEGVSVPFIKMEDCTFLKRAFRLDLERGVYLGPLEVSSLYKTLHTCVKSDTVSLELQNCDMVSSVLFEAFLQGEEFYNDFRLKLDRVLEKCSVCHWFPKGIPSFASQQRVWDERYLEDSGGHENPHGSGVVGDSYIFE